MAKTPIIELRKDDRRNEPGQHGAKAYKLNPGGFDVYVDGQRWGRIFTEPGGPHGIKYKLHQIHSGGSHSAAHREVPTNPNARLRGDRTRMSYFECWSDKVYLRNLKSGAKPVPLEDRLKQLAADALAVNALRDPAVLKVEADKAAAARREREAQDLQDKNALWAGKAREAIGPYAHGMAAPVVADLTARIVEAMKWAQSQ